MAHAAQYHTEDLEYLMILMTVLNAYALDCTGLDTDACNATNDIIDHVNATHGSTVVGDSASGRFGSTSIYNQVLDVHNAVQDEGCNGISGSWGGIYNAGTRSWSGVWSGDAGSGDASGSIDLNTRTWAGSFAGAATGNGGDTFSTFTNPESGVHGKLAGNQGDGFLGGAWIRVSGRTGVYYAVSGTCPAPALDSWLGHPVPSPTAVDGTLTMLGTGTDSLLGGDLTDPENDGNESAGEADASWNWVDAFASHEAGFQGGEFAFNVFDNVLGSGNDKWCCDLGSPDSPVYVGFELASPVQLTHFTISSANDVASRDSDWWHIEGSNNGVDWYPIYVQKADSPIWTQRLQVARIDLDTPSDSYTHFRYISYRSANVLHQLGELELFGN